jgi:hypothetical protein
MTQEICASFLFKHYFIDVAPKPVFTRLDGFHDRVLRGAKMLGGMFVLRGIAAAHMAADLAKTQVHPSVAHFDALLADMNLGFEVANLIGVRASVGHGLSSSSYPET